METREHIFRHMNHNIHVSGTFNVGLASQALSLRKPEQIPFGPVNGITQSSSHLPGSVMIPVASLRRSAAGVPLSLWHTPPLPDHTYTFIHRKNILYVRSLLSPCTVATSLSKPRAIVCLFQLNGS